MASKTMDGPRPVAHVAHAYFKVKYANKKDELEALHRDPVRVSCGLFEAGCSGAGQSCCVDAFNRGIS